MQIDIHEEEFVLESMPEALLAEIFSKGIVVIPEEFEEKQAKPAFQVIEPVPEKISGAAEVPSLPKMEGKTSGKINFLGGFGKKVLVVVSDPTSLHLNEEDFELLGKILASVKLSMADIALVNAATHQLNYYPLQEQLPASVAFYFGIEPVEIGAPIKFPQFQVQNWNSTTFVFAPGLDEMGPLSKNAVALKKELWVAMKKIFG
jgi:hypothetical protein